MTAPIRAHASRTPLPAALALSLAIAAHAPAAAQDDSRQEALATSVNAERAMIHIVPPSRGYRELFSGRVQVETLIIHPLIKVVDFLIDGKRTARVTRKPYIGQVRLADPPRKQMLEVRGYDAQGEILGIDRMPLNQPDVPFGVRVTSMRRLEANGYDALRIEAEVSLPRSATLARVAFYRGERLAEAVRNFGVDAAPGVPRIIQIETLMEYTSADNFVRVTATLDDGRELEDAQLLVGAEYQDEIDIQLVQLQLLVTDNDGNPVSGLKAEDFEIRENGRKRPVENLHTAQDVALVLGLAIDMSDSMVPIWHQVREVSASFVDTTLSPRDRAFVVDFSGEVRLSQPLTGNKRLLASRVRLLVPRIGTALNDGILFSLLQYGREPGRRALVVITDGVDQHSRSTPEQATDFAERLGLPIYFIELDRPAGNSTLPDLRQRLPGLRTRSRNGGPAHITRTFDRRRHRKRLDAIARQTGGRLSSVDLAVDTRTWTKQIQDIFRQIEADLRHQHVLTYYSDRPPGTPIDPEVTVTGRGLELRSAVPLEAIE